MRSIGDSIGCIFLSLPQKAHSIAAILLPDLSQIKYPLELNQYLEWAVLKKGLCNVLLLLDLFTEFFWYGPGDFGVAFWSGIFFCISLQKSWGWQLSCKSYGRTTIADKHWGIRIQPCSFLWWKAKLSQDILWNRAKICETNWNKRIQFGPRQSVLLSRAEWHVVNCHIRSKHSVGLWRWRPHKGNK